MVISFSHGPTKMPCAVAIKFLKIVRSHIGVVIQITKLYSSTVLNQ